MAGGIGKSSGTEHAKELLAVGFRSGGCAQRGGRGVQRIRDLWGGGGGTVMRCVRLMEVKL